MSPFPSTRVLHPRFSAYHQPVAAGAMTAECRIAGRPSGPATYDPATGSSSTTAGAQQYVGRCRVQPHMRATLADQAGQEITSRRYLVAIPATAGPIRESADVTITACVDDPQLVGRVLSVEDVQYASTRFERDLIVVDNLG